jgi:hypothetical protein
MIGYNEISQIYRDLVSDPLQTLPKVLFYVFILFSLTYISIWLKSRNSAKHRKWKKICGMISICSFAATLLSFAISLFFPKMPTEGSNGQELNVYVQNRTFFISEFANPDLVSKIKAFTGYQWAESSKAEYIITFDYASKFRKSILSENYLYDGGNLTLIINGEMCNSSNFQLSLPKYVDEPGNPKQILEKEIKKYINTKISNDPDSLAGTIGKCIKANLDIMQK